MLRFAPEKIKRQTASGVADAAGKPF